MDLTFPIIAIVGYIGYNFSQKAKRSREIQNIRTELEPSEITNGLNVYESEDFAKYKASEQALADKNWKLAEDPVNTNIIPPLFNSTAYNNAFTFNATPPLLSTPPQTAPTSTAARTVASAATNATSEDKKRETEILEGPMFRNSNSTYKFPGKIVEDSTGFDPLLKESFTSDLTGLKKDMTHNNMVPFYGSSVKQNISEKGGMLEKFYTPTMPKKEVVNDHPLNKQNVFGARADYESLDRFTASSLKTNLLPAPQIMVQPIPGEFVRPTYKTIDELRGELDKQVTYEGRLLPGGGNFQRGVQATVSKNRPERFVVNEGQDNLLMTTGARVKNTNRENFSAKYNNRQDTIETMYNINPGMVYDKGLIPVVKEGDKDTLFSISREDHRQTLKPTGWVLNRNDRKKSNKIEKGSFVAREQERETTNRLEWRNANDKRKGFYQTTDEEAKTTNKELNLTSYTGIADSFISAPTKTDSEGTREPQFINYEHYLGVASSKNGGTSNDRAQYKNREINTNRETISDLKGYMAQGVREKKTANKNSLNMVKRNPSLPEVNTFGNVTLPSRNAYSPSSTNTSSGNKKIEEHDYSSRIGSNFTSALKSNPYSLLYNQK